MDARKHDGRSMSLAALLDRDATPLDGMFGSDPSPVSKDVGLRLKRLMGAAIPRDITSNSSVAEHVAITQWGARKTHGDKPSSEALAHCTTLDDGRVHDM